MLALILRFGRCGMTYVDWDEAEKRKKVGDSASGINSFLRLDSPPPPRSPATDRRRLCEQVSPNDRLLTNKADSALSLLQLCAANQGILVAGWLHVTKLGCLESKPALSRQQRPLRTQRWCCYPPFINCPPTPKLPTSIRPIAQPNPPASSAFSIPLPFPSF